MDPVHIIPEFNTVMLDQAWAKHGQTDRSHVASRPVWVLEVSAALTVYSMIVNALVVFNVFYIMDPSADRG